MIFTDGSVKRGVQSGWEFVARLDGTVIMEDCGATDLTASSMTMEIKAISEALRWVGTYQVRHVIIATDSMSTLEKLKSGYLYSDWEDTIKASSIERVTWLFCPGHAGVLGNVRADELAGSAAMGAGERICLDAPTVLLSSY